MLLDGSGFQAWRASCALSLVMYGSWASWECACRDACQLFTSRARDAVLHRPVSDSAREQS